MKTIVQPSIFRFLISGQRRCFHSSTSASFPRECLTVRLLQAPVQFAQDAPDVSGLNFDVESLLDQISDSWTGP
jgi:hypothetical protein